MGNLFDKIYCWHVLDNPNEYCCTKINIKSRTNKKVIWSNPGIDWLHHILKKYDVLYETNIAYFFFFSTTLYHVIHKIRNVLLNKNKRFNFAINKTELKAFSFRRLHRRGCWVRWRWSTWQSRSYFVSQNWRRLLLRVWTDIGMQVS